MPSSKNLEYEKTSFLNKSNSTFIEQMYLKFINNDSDLPESWRLYFEEIGDEINLIVKEINGPSWGPANKKINIREIEENFKKHQLEMRMSKTASTTVKQKTVFYFFLSKDEK